MTKDNATLTSVPKIKSGKNYVYILQCSDDTFYTGWTTDIERRLKVHNEGTGNYSKYTRARRPVKLVHLEELPDRSSALKREAAIKKLSRIKKQALVDAEPYVVVDEHHNE